MKKLPKTGQAYRAQTLISLLIAIALFAILARALFTLVSSSYSLVGFTSARITAKHLALEKVESIRNLPFDQVGTVGGIPDGSIEQVENTVINGLSYQISTSIIYVDDPFDQLAPIDLLPTDYKRARVEVSWEGLAASNKNPVTLLTDVVPRSVETTEGGGILSVLIFDANAQPVDQAEVKIVATTSTPQIDLTIETNENGIVILPGAPPCINCYEITVTKLGYSSDRTYSNSEITNPIKPHLNVVEGELTEISFAIDKLSTLNIFSYSGTDDVFTSLGNVNFTLRGQKILGTDDFDNLVYKFDNSYQTSASGEIELKDIEWDNYTVILPSGSSLTISGTKPLMPLTLLPETAQNFYLSFTTKPSHSLLSIFTDTADNSIASVSATLYDDVGFNATGSSGISVNPNFGQIFFSDLVEQTYHLIATISGFFEYTGDVDVSGNSVETIVLDEE